MKRLRLPSFAFVFLTVFLLSAGVSGAPATKSIDLKPFLGKSQFQTVNADWILPRGRQVVEGVPFQVDGILEVAGTSARFSNVGRTNVDNIPIAASFERLYLLAAASRDVNEGVAVARLTLQYVDGSRTDLPIEYGRHVLDWMTARHKGEAPLMEPDARVAWQVEHTAAAKRDDSLRLYYMTLANPDPVKEVRSLTITSARARGGFMVAAMTVGPERVERLPDTLSKVEEHFHIEGAPGGKPALTGRVSNETGGPVTNAMLRVISVKTVETTDKATPEDNQFVGREVKTDATGRYRMPDLSERLTYRLLILAPGSQGGMFDGADPLAGETHIRLKSGSDQSGQFMVQARLVGPEDKPVVGATVKPDGVGNGMGTSWGGNNGFASEVMSGLNGEFIMARDTPFTRMSVDIKHPGLAPAKVWLPVSNGVHVVKLGTGAMLTGRVLKDGQPMADVEVGVSGVNRSSEVYAGHYEVKADADGRFRLEHLPPNVDWHFYGLMRSFRREGSLPPRVVKTGGHNETNDLGDLTVQPSVTLAGVVKTKDGQPLPSGLRLTVSYDSAWDSQAVRVDRTGNFEAPGLHPGQVEIHLSVRDWVPTGENRSLDEWNPWTLTGQLTEDKRDMLILIEKKERNYNNNPGGGGYLPDSDRARNRPLFGAEPSGPSPIYLAGVVVDDVSGAPIRNVRITPGRKPQPAVPATAGGLLQTLIEAARPRPTPWNERPFWENGRMETSVDGRFSIANRKLTSLPILRVEADEYDVLETAPMSQSASNLTLRMKKGSGPKGTLLGVNGQPAAGTTILFGAEQEQFSMNVDGTLTAYGQNRSAVVTKPDGTFAFPSKSNGRRVFAANDDGWTSVAMKDWPANGRIQLSSWAKMQGALVDGAGKPVANTQVAIETARQYEEGDAWVNFQERPTTDGNGQFSFKRVPPGDGRLVYLIPMKGGGWMHGYQTNFTVKPGQTLDLGKMKQAPRPQGID